MGWDEDEEVGKVFSALWDALRKEPLVPSEDIMALILNSNCGLEKEINHDVEFRGPIFACESLKLGKGARPLLVAALANRLDVVVALVAAGADPTVRCRGIYSYSSANSGRTAVHYAAYNGNCEMITFLCQPQQSCEPGVADRDGDTPLHFAAERGHLDAVRLLLSFGCDVNAIGDLKRTAIHWASLNGFCEVVDFLILNGGDCKILDEVGQSAVHLAASAGHVPVLRRLGQEGCDVNGAEFRSGSSPLHLAVMKNSLPAATWLMENGAELNEQDFDGCTPLYLTIKKAKPRMLSLLVQFGCDPSVPDHKGHTPLHLTANNVEMTTILLEAGANVDAKNDNGSSPLFVAVSRNNFAVAMLLVKYGCDVSLFNDEGFTPLHKVAKHEVRDRCFEIGRVLIDNGCDLDAVAAEMPIGTPLHVAANYGAVDQIRCLVAEGANRNIEDTFSNTPYEVARRRMARSFPHAFEQLKALLIPTQ